MSLSLARNLQHGGAGRRNTFGVNSKLESIGDEYNEAEVDQANRRMASRVRYHQGSEHCTGRRPLEGQPGRHQRQGQRLSLRCLTFFAPQVVLTAGHCVDNDEDLMDKLQREVRGVDTQSEDESLPTRRRSTGSRNTPTLTPATTTTTRPAVHEHGLPAGAAHQPHLFPSRGLNHSTPSSCVAHGKRQVRIAGRISDSPQRGCDSCNGSKWNLVKRISGKHGWEYFELLHNSFVRWRRPRRGHFAKVTEAPRWCGLSSPKAPGIRPG